MRRWLFQLLLLLSFPALAQQELEIIPLQHRAVEHILPVITPFVEADGMVSGMNNQIILRASRRNIAQIREIIATLDTAPRRLMITVSNDLDEGGRRQGGGVSARIRLGEGAAGGIQGRAYETVSSGSRSGSQRIQVIEGGSGYISVGRSLPIPLRQVLLGPGGVAVSDSVVYRDIGSGFHAAPRVVGDTVTLEISPRFDTPDRGGANIRRLSTTVTGKLGEWIELGGSAQDGSGSERGYTSLATTRERDRHSVWLKVEELE